MARIVDQGIQTGSAVGPVATSPLEQYGTLVCEAAAKVFSALCGRPVRLAVDRTVPGSPASLPSLVPGSCVGMAMRISQGRSGIVYLIWKADDAIALAQLILGEEPTPGAEASADYRDALSEAANQIGGSLSTALRTVLGVPVTVEAGPVTALADAGACLEVFRDEPPAPMLCVASVTREESAPGEVALIVSSSLLPETDKTRRHDDVSVAKEGTVSATSAAAGPAPFAPLAGGERASSNNGIDMLLDVNLQVSVELGRTRLQIRDILQLGPGSIVELDKQAGDAVDILVNDKPIAKGEVIIIDENFGVRLTSITSVTDRIKNLR